MSLNFSFTEIEDYKERCYIPNEDGTFSYTARAEALVWLMLTIGMRQITEANSLEVYLRIHAEEMAYGPRRYDYKLHENEDQKVHTRTDVYYTLEDVRAFIGLSTNVSEEPAGKWWPRFFKQYKERK
jgi:hypothetical protein